MQEQDGFAIIPRFFLKYFCEIVSIIVNNIFPVIVFLFSTKTETRTFKPIFGEPKCFYYIDCCFISGLLKCGLVSMAAALFRKSASSLNRERILTALFLMRGHTFWNSFRRNCFHAHIEMNNMMNSFIWNAQCLSYIFNHVMDCTDMFGDWPRNGSSGLWSS